MALDFPTSPALNQTYTFGSYTWRWDGTSWVGAVPIVNATINNTTIGAVTPSTGAFTTVTATTPIAGASGGTGVNNGANTLTLAGNVTHAGAFTQSFTATANTSLTLPVTGTLATLAGSEALSNKTITASPISGSTGAFTTLSASGVTTIGNGSSQNSVFDLIVGSAGATTGDNSGVVVVNNATGKGWIGFNNANNASIPGQVTYDHSTNTLALVANGVATANVTSTGLAVTGALSTTGASQAANTLTMLYTGIQAGTIGITSNGAMAFGLDGSTGTTERMRISTSGNVGIGTSTPASQLDLTKTGDAVLSLTSSGVQRYQLIARSSGNFEIYDQSGAASRVAITQAGNVGIGVTPSAYSASWKAAQIGAFGALVGHASVGAVRLTSNTFDDGTEKYIGSTYASKYEQYESQHKWYTAPSGTAGNAISFTQAMTLDASGNLLVGTTSADGKISLSYSYPQTGASLVTNSTNTQSAMTFSNPNGVVGTINTAASVCTFNSVSDYRRKSNVKDLTGSGSFIDALKPRTFDWDTGDKGVGFIAHEFAEVSPSSVTGEKDAVDADGKPIYQAMQASSAEVIANLVAELQSVRKRLSVLEGN